MNTMDDVMGSVKEPKNEWRKEFPIGLSFSVNAQHLLEYHKEESFKFEFEREAVYSYLRWVMTFYA